MAARDPRSSLVGEVNLAVGASMDEDRCLPDDESIRWPSAGLQRLEREYRESGCEAMGLRIRDPRLKKVWTHIFRSTCQIVSAGLEALPRCFRCIDEQGLSDRDKAAVALFLVTFQESLDPTHGYEADHESNDDFYLRLIGICTSFQYSRFSDEFERRLGALHPSRNKEMANSLEQCAVLFRKVREIHQSLDSVRWNHSKTAQEQGAGTKDYKKSVKEAHPAVVRAQLAAMIQQVDTLFVPPLRTPLATIASFMLCRTISVKDVENSRSSLGTHRTPKKATEI